MYLSFCSSYQWRGQRLLSVGLSSLFLSILNIWQAQLPASAHSQGAIASPQQRPAAKQIFDEAVALQNQGTAESYRKAVARYEAAAQLFSSEGDKSQEGLSFLAAGVLSNDLGERQKALNYYERALQSFHATEDRRGEAAALNDIGLVYDALGDKQKALDHYGRALPLRHALKDQAGEATTLHNIGLVYEALGEKKKALDYYEQALVLTRAVGDRRNVVVTLHNIGSVYNTLGEKQKSLKYFEEALLLAREVKYRVGEATTLTSIGYVYSSLREKQKALDYYGQALPITREVGDRVGEAVTLSNIGEMYSGLGEKQKALENYKQGASLFRAMGDRGSEGKALTGIGGVYSGLGEWQRALDYYGQAVPLLRAVGAPEDEATAFGGIGLIWNRLQQPRGAIAFLKQAVMPVQQLRGANRGLDTEAQRGFFQSKEKAYFLLTDWLLSQGRLAEAMQVMNLARDQEFYDQPDRSAGAAVAGAPPLSLTMSESDFVRRVDDSLGRITPISQRLAKLQAQINTRRPSVQEAEQLKRLNSALDAEAASFQKLLPQLVAEIQTAPETETRLASTTDLADMQQTLRTLEKQTGTKAAAVYVLMGTEDCHTLLVTAKAITAASAKIKAADLNRKAQAFLQRLQNDHYDPQALGKELYDVIFKPIESEVKDSGATLLMWSLDRNLRSLPMAALWDGEKYLAERFQHAVFTRPTPERLLREVSRRWTGQGFGTSRAWLGFSSLPGVERELSLIFGDAKTRRPSLIPGKAALDDSFTKESFLAALKQGAPLLHIASHFSFRPGDDNDSFLLLGNGEKLTLAEMKQTPELFRGVELLTLSACNTATQRGDEKFGREVDGFAELAQRLRAGAVMASLWEVSDATTPELMAEFYRLRESGIGMTKAVALQQAQLALLNGAGFGKTLAKPSNRSPELLKDLPKYKVDPKRPYAHPYYWAPFVLIGNWR